MRSFLNACTGLYEVPYSRGDVLLTPDKEALQDAARLTRAWLRETERFMLTDVTPGRSAGCRRSISRGIC